MAGAARRLRVGVAGAGHFGRYHALKVASAERAVLAGIYDPDEERAKTIGWETGAPAMPLELVAGRLRRPDCRGSGRGPF